MTKAAPLALIYTLPVILGCALLGGTEARAAPYVVTIDQEGLDVVATSNAGGAIDTSPLGTPNGGSPTGMEPSVIQPSTSRLQVGATGPTSFWNTVSFTGPASFGSGMAIVSANPAEGTGPSAGIALGFNLLSVPNGYSSGNALPISRSVWTDQTFATLGITPGTYTWTWAGGTASTEQSFTIHAVPGPIVGAGLPGLIAALGGLVAMARRRRKQLA